ncbi:MAG: hypothetical protein AAF668_03405 [Pseudomonadota bacterium]
MSKTLLANKRVFVTDGSNAAMRFPYSRSFERVSKRLATKPLIKARSAAKVALYGYNPVTDGLCYYGHKFGGRAPMRKDRFNERILLSAPDQTEFTSG